jgi:magnesium-transporting ATPase (P-type)
MAFDKTGTLTEDHLEFYGVIPMNHSSRELQESTPDINNSMSTERVLVTCHGLSVLNGVLLGYAVDKQMFQSTKWTIVHDKTLFSHISESSLIEFFVEPPKRMDSQIYRPPLGILKRYEFDPHIARSSSLCIDIESKKIYVTCKGSSESIEKVCDPASLPGNYHSIVREYSSNGFYVLACAYKEVDGSVEEAIKLSRESVDKDLIFTGFIVMSVSKIICSFLTCMLDVLSKHVS